LQLFSASEKAVEVLIIVYKEIGFFFIKPLKEQTIRGMANNNFSRFPNTGVPFADQNYLADDLSNGHEVPCDHSSVEKVEEEPTESQDTVRSSNLALKDRTISERGMDLGEEERSQRKARRRYYIFPAMPSEDPGTPPDGGTLAWLQVLAGHLMCFITWGLITSFGVFQSYYEEILGAAPSVISWIGTIQIFTLLLVGTFSGRASDAGLVHEAVFAGTLMTVFGIFMTSLATEYYQLFLSQGICVGLGMGILYMPGLSVPSSYFKDKKPLAVAIIASGAGSGGLVYPAMVQQLLPRIGAVSSYPKRLSEE
jgi:hypothetical protein